MMNRQFVSILFAVLVICGAVIAQGNRDWREKDRAPPRERDYERTRDEDYYHGRDDRVLFEKVTALTFRKEDYTTGRRSSPIRALQCIGGTAGCTSEPEVVQCTRTGFDGYDSQWRCEADLSTDVKFGEVEVSCEGYAYPEDVYILKGSCGLKYKLDFTDAGKQRKKYDEAHPYRGPQQKVETQEIRYAQNEEGVMPLLGNFGSNWTGGSGFSLWSIIKWGFYASLFFSLFFGFSVFRWALSLAFLPVTLPLRLLRFLLGGASSASAYHGYNQGGGYQYYGGGGSAGSGIADILGSYFTPKVYQPAASGGGFWSGLFYGGLAGSVLGRWLGGGTRQTRQQQPQGPQTVRVVKTKEDPRDKRPEPATTRMAAGFGGTTRR